jgi:branched-subunit amino acid aminotransferase/4-amino-4-deoxychorismate lyase
MHERIAFLNGAFLPERELAVSVVDAGFVLGVTIAEQLRTFRGTIFRAEDHLSRLYHSLEILGVDIGYTAEQLKSAAEYVVASNRQLIHPADDMGVSIFVTPGRYAAYSGPGPSVPMVAIHTYPLPFYLWAHKYTGGESVAVASVRQVPVECWPRELKCRSRMHYYLAEKEVQRIDPSARPILLDADGCVTEAPTANIVAYHGEEGLIAPPVERTLPGISLKVVTELASQLGIPFSHRFLTVSDLEQCDEIFLASTPFCLLPVVRLNGAPVGQTASGKPGPIYRRLLAAWNEIAGFDLVAQAQQFRHRL